MLKPGLLGMIVLSIGLNACHPPKLAGSRLRSGSSASASVTLVPPSDASGQFAFIHNHPDIGPENYKMSSLIVSLPAVTSPVSIESTSNRLSLAPLRFAVAMVASNGIRKLTCDSPGIPFGTSSISCTLDGSPSDGVDLTKAPDQQIASYILAERCDISTALADLKARSNGGSELPAAVVAHWQNLEALARKGGGMFGVPDALASEIRSWNADLDFQAEKVATVLVQVYRDLAPSTGSNTSISLKNSDLEIAKYIVTQKSSIASALYFVKTNIIKSEFSSSVVDRWTSLERDAKSYHGEIEALTRKIEMWNLDLGYSPESIASAMAGNYR